MKITECRGCGCDCDVCGKPQMPVPRCDGCKFWCSRETMTDGYCDYASIDRAKMCADGYDGVLTEADFGCVQWSAK